MRYLRWLFACLFAVIVSCNEQDIIKERTEYQYESYDYTKYQVIEYSITNNSSDPYLTFISYNHSDDVNKAILYYFNKPHGDFSLLNMMTDNIVYIDPLPIVVGRTFIKQIKKNECFRYAIVGPVTENIDIGKHIITERQSHIEDLLGIKILDNMSYKESSLVISHQ